eukprot:TRINITY_DN26128_c0_g1_i3.p2 TRINITY_DN26128_c0_g1~~TRINITY_DN26128_c0_g1_i3.p2  ORF type:complete len:242 (-),score=43.21 TRINITY_DN26128_c0_g1_i3:220-870(-)
MTNLLGVVLVACLFVLVVCQRDCTRVDLSRSLLLRETKLDDVTNPGLNFLATLALDKLCDVEQPNARCKTNQENMDLPTLCEQPISLVGIKEAVSYGFNSRTNLHGLAMRTVVYLESLKTAYELVVRLAVGDDGQGDVSMETDDTELLTHCLDEKVNATGILFESSCIICEQEAAFDPCKLPLQFGFPCATPSTNETTATTDIAALLGGSTDQACQ